MNILITGGNGFIGSNFIKNILKNKNVKKVINIDKNSYESVRDSFLNIKSKKYVKIKDNLSNLNKIVGILKKYKINIILHMAAESHVDRSILNPVLYVKSNILPTVNLLTAMNQVNYLREIRFIYFSTEIGSVAVIGNIIPGLIANWMDRQGVIRTISVVILTAVIVKLTIIILFGGVIFEQL